MANVEDLWYDSSSHWSGVTRLEDIDIRSKVASLVSLTVGLWNWVANSEEYVALGVSGMAVDVVAWAGAGVVVEVVID